MRSMRGIMGVVAAMALLLAACGSEGDGAAVDEPAEAPDVAAEDGEAEAPDVAADDGEAAEPLEVDLGVLVQMTGVSGDFGINVQHAVDLATEELIDAGRVTISPVYEDHQVLPEVALVGFEKLISQDNTDYVISNGSSILLAIGPIANEEEVLILNIAGVTPELRALAPWIVNLIPTADVDGRQLAEHMYNELDITQAAGIYVNAEYGIASMGEFQEAFEALGGEVVASETHAVGVVDMRTPLLRVKDADPEALVIFSNEGELGHIVAQAREVGIEGGLFGTSFMLREANYEIAGDAMEGVRGVSYQFDPTATERSRDFVEKYEGVADGTSPDVSAILAYDAVYLLAEALEAVGDDPAAVREYIVSVSDWPGIIGDVNFDDGGTIDLPMSRWEIVDGEPVFTDPL